MKHVYFAIALLLVSSLAVAANICPSGRPEGNSPVLCSNDHKVPVAQLPLEGTGTTTSSATNTLVHGGDGRLSDARTPTGSMYATSPVQLSTGTVTTTATSAALASSPTVSIATNVPGGVPTLGTDTKISVSQLPVGTTAGTVAAGDDTRFAGAIQSGFDPPRTIYYPYYFSGTTYYFDSWGDSATGTHATSVTSTPAVVVNAQGSTNLIPNLTVWPAGVYRLKLWANMASTEASVYFTITAGSTVIATSSTITVSTGSIQAHDMTATAATDYTTANTSDALTFKVYASSASTNNITIGYGGANSTYLAAPWTGFSKADPVMAGTASAGTLRICAMSDHRHPAQTHASDDVQKPSSAGTPGYVLETVDGTATNTQWVANGSGTGIGCSGTCSTGHLAAIADSTHITNATSSDVTTALGYTPVNPTRTILTTYGLQGGGNLSTNLELSPVYGTTANTVMQGNDTRVVNALQQVGLNCTHADDVTTVAGAVTACGYGTRTVNFLTATDSTGWSVTSLTSITGASVTWTAVAGENVEIDGVAYMYAGSSATTACFLGVSLGGVVGPYGQGTPSWSLGNYISVHTHNVLLGLSAGSKTATLTAAGEGGSCSIPSGTTSARIIVKRYPQ